MIFDLDGTLVETEGLKARSYAIASQHVQGLAEPDGAVIEAYRSIVGATRDAAAQFITEQIGIGPVLAKLTGEYGVDEPWQVLSAMRVAIYDEMVADPQTLRDAKSPHAITLLRVAKESACRTALATMSHREEALHVLRSLELEQWLDLVLTRDDVERSKPDPEIYMLAAQRLRVPPADCLVLEDSANGVRAGVAAGMNVVAFATPFTTEGLYASGVLEHIWMVHDPATLLDVVQRRIEVHNTAVE